MSKYKKISDKIFYSLSGVLTGALLLYGIETCQSHKDNSKKNTEVETEISCLEQNLMVPISINKLDILDRYCEYGEDSWVCKEIERSFYQGTIEKWVGSECRERENLNTPNCIETNKYIDIQVDCLSKELIIDENGECGKSFDFLLIKLSEHIEKEMKKCETSHGGN